VHIIRFAPAFALAAITANTYGAQAATSGISLSGLSPLYTGVDVETASIPSNPAVTGGPATTSRAYVARIDLRAPGISLVTTPQSGPLNTVSEPISNFVAEQGVRIAINANFFAPCCDAFAEPKTVIGLLVSFGKVVAPLSTDPLNSAFVLAFTRDNRAVIAPSTAIDVAKTYTAVAGSAIIVTNGVDTSASSPDEGDPADPNPRTLVGLSKDARYLYLVTIDGRVTGYSTGTTNGQSAALMLALKCYNALNLDGGGSTEMVRADKLGHPFIVNIPSGGAERFDAAALGVLAQPLPANLAARH
jgi:hypothetical protein